MRAPTITATPLAGAAASRGNQKAALAGVVHEKRTDAEIGTLLAKLTAAGAGAGLDKWEAAVVRDAAKDYRKATCIPKARGGGGRGGAAHRGCARAPLRARRLVAAPPV